MFPFEKIALASLRPLFSIVLAAFIIVAGISFIAGREYAKHEMRESYCQFFANDPRCK